VWPSALFQFRSARVVATDRPERDHAAARRELLQALETAREQLGDIHDSSRRARGRRRRPSSTLTERCCATRIS